MIFLIGAFLKQFSHIPTFELPTPSDIEKAKFRNRALLSFSPGSRLYYIISVKGI